MHIRSKLGLCLASAALTAAVIVVAYPSRLGAQQSGSAAERAARAARIQQIRDALTVEALIGSAVSLANQDYTEVEEAVKRFLNGDSAGARSYLEMAKQKFPQLPPVDVTLSKMHSIAGNTPAAQQLLERAVTNHPDDPEAYLLLADQAFSKGRLTEAEAVFKMTEGVVDKFSGNDKRLLDFKIRVIAGQAAVLERRREWDQALPLLQQWVDLSPDSSAARHRLGMTLFMTNQAEAAFKQFKESRDIDPKRSHPYVTLGLLLTQRAGEHRAKGDDAKADNELEKARIAFERAYKEDGDNEQTIQSYTEWLIQQNELDKAKEVVEALRQASPQSVTAMLLQGTIAKLQGDLDGVKAAMNNVLALDPANATAQNLLALTLIESNDKADRERALSYATMNAERFANLSQANVTLAWVLHRLGRDAEAQERINLGVQGGRVSADSAYLVAAIMHEVGRSKEAKQMLDQLLQRTGSGTFLFKQEAEELQNQLQGLGQ